MAKVTLVRRPPPPNQQATVIRNRARALIMELMQEVAQKHRDYVGTWEVSAPDFQVQEESARDNLVIGVLMEGEEAEQATLSVWQLLDRGTDVRYMQLSDDWSSKTTPRATESGSGAGHTTGLDLGNPQSGIEPRKIAESIAELFDANETVRDGYEEGFEANFR